MTWKDTLRKAPFDTGQMRRDSLKNMKEKNQRRLEDFPNTLEIYVDEVLEEAIRTNPKSDTVEIKISVGLRSALNDLVENGIKISKLEQIMEDEYNVDDVRITLTDSKARITFRGIGMRD
tara:strand:+ start:817 stop:1176 length:360 start_codon:yes stop_codon:yes gene_type:complete